MSAPGRVPGRAAGQVPDTLSAAGSTLVGVPLATEVRRLGRWVKGLVLAAVLTAALGLAASTLAREHALDQRNAHQANQTLLRDLLVAQSGLRGFVATGDESFLSGAASSAELRRQAAAMSDREADVQPKDLEQQRRGVEAWVSYRDALVQDRRAGRDVTARLATTPFPDARRTNAEVERQLTTSISRWSPWTGRAILWSGVLVTLELMGLLLVLTRLQRELGERVVRPLETLTRTVAAGTGARAPVDEGPTEIRELSRVVNDYLCSAEQSEADRLLEARVSRAKGRTALSIRRSLSEEAVLRALEDGLVQGMAASHVVVLRHELDNPLWRAVVSRTGADHRVLEVDQQRHLAPDLEECARIVGDETWLGAVVRADGRPAAVVLVTSRSARTWAPAEKDLLEQVCEYATRGIDQSRFEAERAEQLTRLEALDRQKTDFMATVSHELRTPLTSIAGYLEMIEDGDFGDLPEDAVPVLGVLQRNTARLRSLIEDLLVLSRIEASGVDLDVSSVEVQVLVDQVVENLRPQAVTGDVTLVQGSRADGLVIDGDQGQLERAVTNVVGNAVKFTPRGGSVVVDVNPDGDFVEIAVRDTGIGIPADDLQDIGRRFFRARNVTSQTIPGTGLGLSIVQAIAEAHRGQMRLDSVVGQGTCVTVRLARRVLRGATAGD